jgi:hypothetical protein
VVRELRLAKRLVAPSNFWRVLEDLGQSFPLSSGGLYWRAAPRSPNLVVEI